MAIDTNSPRTRRNLLAAGLGGLAATVATAIGRPNGVSAANGDPVLAGQANSATAPTSLTNATGNQVGLGVTSGATDQFVSTAVEGFSESGTGIAGVTSDGMGVWGEGYWGVYGAGAAGVVGDTDAGTGVLGWTGAAEAPLPPGKVGVFAGAENGRHALLVSGVARFSRSGRVNVGPNKSSVTVLVGGGISTNSFGFATLQTNRTGVYVQAVVPRTTDSTITIYLNKVASTTTNTVVGWLVLR